MADLPGGGLAIRDSKNADGPVLFFTPAERAALRFVPGWQLSPDAGGKGATDHGGRRPLWTLRGAYDQMVLILQ